MNFSLNKTGKITQLLRKFAKNMKIRLENKKKINRKVLLLVNDLASNLEGKKSYNKKAILIPKMTKKISFFFNKFPVFGSVTILRILFDSVVCFMILFYLFLSSLIMCYNYNPDQVVVYSMDVIALILLLESLVNFNSTYFEKGLEIKNRKKIILNYFK